MDKSIVSPFFDSTVYIGCACAGMTSARSKSSLIKPVSATLLTLTVILQATLTASQGSLSSMIVKVKVVYCIGAKSKGLTISYLA